MTQSNHATLRSFPPVPLSAAVPSLPSILRLLPAAIGASLQSAGSVRRFPPGTVLARRGAPCASLLVIVEGILMVGELDAQGGYVPVTLLGKDDVFGMHAHVPDSSCAFDLVAGGRSELVVFEVPGYALAHAMSLDTTHGLPALANPALRRVVVDLQNLTKNPTGFLELAAQFTARDVGDGEEVSAAGDAACWTIVECGALRHGERALGPGEDFGLELALLRVPHSGAATIARGPTRVLQVGAAALAKVTHRYPHVREALAQRVALAASRHSRAPRVVHTDFDLRAEPDLSLESRDVEAAPVLGKAVRPWRLRPLPFHRQQEPMDCGAACLRMIARYHGHEVDYQALQSLTVVSRYGSSLLDLARAGEQLGFATSGVQVESEALREVPLPAVAHLEDRNHFVVVWRVSGRHVVIGDPSFATRKIARVEFERDFRGTLLLLQPTDRLAQAAAQYRPQSRAQTPLSQFLAFVRPYRRVLVELAAVSLALQLIALALPLGSQIVIDRVILRGDTRLLDVLLIALVSAALLSAALTFARAYLVLHTATRIERDLVETLYRRVLDGVSGFFQRFTTSDVLNRFLEVALIRSFVIDNAVSLAIDLVMILGMAGVLVLYAPPLALIALGAIPLQLALTLAMGRAMAKHSAAYLDHQDAYQTHLMDSFKGFELIKTHALELPFVRKAQRLLAPALQSSFRATLHGSLGASISYGVDLLGSALVLWAGARMVSGGQLSLGTLIAFTLIARQIGVPILRLANQWRDYQRTKADLARVGALLDMPTDHDKRVDAVFDLPAAAGLIRFREVSFAYGGPSAAHTLERIDLEIAAGEIVALVGPSGCGKSTLVRLLLRMYDPSEGSVFIDGYNLRDASPDSIRRQIGLVTQDTQLLSGSVYENIACGRAVTREAVVSAAHLSGAYEFISELPHGFQTLVGERGMSLSGGQRQRIVIARALVTDPRILVFDEATAALDPLSEQLIHERLREVVRGRTTIIISHRMQTLRHADRIVVMNGGKISQVGTHDSLLAASGKLYAALAQATPDWKRTSSEATHA